MNPGFGALVAIVGILAGGVASIAGFGIGSLLTPLLALQTSTQLAVAAVAVATNDARGTLKPNIAAERIPP